MKKKARKANPRMRRIVFQKIQRYLASFAILLMVGGLVSAAIMIITQVKGKKTDQDDLILEESTGDIVGIPGVPVYPGSTFMFSSHIGEELVQSFLMKGRSAYVLPTDDLWENVVSFYEEQLPHRGWRHVLSVEIADKDRIEGEYWVFEIAVSESGSGQPDSEAIESSQSMGLRIYGKSHSIWFERISYDEALAGLSHRIAREEEIDLIISMGSTEELPESFPWSIDYPEMWDAEVRESVLSGAPLVEFSGGDLSGIISIEPIAFYAGQELSTLGNSFISEVNGRRPEEAKFELIGTEEVLISGQSAASFDLRDADTEAFVAVVIHPANGIVYAISSLEGDEAYFQYVIERMEVRN